MRTSSSLDSRRVVTGFMPLMAVAVALFSLSTLALSSAATASEPGVTDLSVHLSTVKARLDKGEKGSASRWLQQLIKRYDPESLPVVDAVTLGVLLVRVGLDGKASSYFRAVTARRANEGSMGANELSMLAGAIYAVGRPEAALAVLKRCNSRFAKHPTFCHSWTIAEVAAAKEDWQEAARVLDAELLSDGEVTVVTGQNAPIRILKLRLSVAWHRGNKLAIGRWRSILVRRGVTPELAISPTPVRKDRAELVSKPKRSGLMWVVMSLSVLLLIALLLARRSEQEQD